MKLCDSKCNECPIIGHSNSLRLTRILNELLEKFGDEVRIIVQKNCPKMTICYNCHIADFCHIEDCEIVNDLSV